jgi:hypothetical protein
VFPLKTVWEHSLIPAIKKSLTAHAGELACWSESEWSSKKTMLARTQKHATPAGWRRRLLTYLGWKIELQVPQGKTFISLFVTTLIRNNYFFIVCRAGPYTNVLDLYIFPSMSHRRSALLQLYYNNTEACQQRANLENNRDCLERYLVFWSCPCICSCIPYHETHHWGEWKQLMAVPWRSTLWCTPGLYEHTDWD